MNATMDRRRGDRFTSIAAMLWIGLVGGYSTVVLPLIVSGASAEYGVQPADVGPIASSEMAGIAVGAFVTGLLVPTRDRRYLTVGAALLMLLGNAGSGLLPLGLPLLYGFRAVAGLGSGALLAIMAACVGTTSQPDRNFAWFVALAFALAAVGFRVLPAIIASAPASLLFDLLAALAVTAAVAARLLPSRAPQADEPAGVAATRHAVPLDTCTYLALGGILAYYLGVGSVWTAMSGIGLAAGIGSEGTASILARAAILGIIGSVLAGVMGARPGRMISLLIGLGSLVAILLWLTADLSQASFAVAPLLFLLSWNYVVPYMMGTVAILDRSGRALAINMTLQYVGFAVGPMLMTLLVREGSYRNLTLFGAAAFAACSGLFVLALVLSRRRDAAAIAMRER